MLLPPTAAAESPLPFLTLRQIRQLPPEILRQKPQVRTEGIVVYHEPDRYSTFIADGEDALYILVRPTLGAAVLKPGTRVSVEGLAVAGEFSTCLEGPGRTSVSLRVLGSAPLPPATPMTPAALAEPIHDSRWIETPAVVRSVTLSGGRALLEVTVEQHRFKALLLEDRPATADTLPWHLLEKKVRLRAVTASLFNSERQMTGRIFYIHSPKEITLLEKPADPALPPLRPLNTLLRADRADAYGSSRVTGIVTYALAGEGIYLRGEGGGLWVQTAQPVKAVPGSVVAVTGFPALASFRPFLRGTAVEIVSTQAPPAALPITPEQALTARHQADLVSMEGTLVKLQPATGHTILHLDRDAKLFQALLPTAPKESPLPQLGSRLRLQGICIVRTENETQVPQAASSFQIHLRGPADITILQKPSWWNLPRVLTALSVVGVIAAAGLVQAGLLRRRVATLSARLKEEAVHNERLRIARDLHDDLGSRVTHLGSLASFGEEDARHPESRGQFSVIRQTAREIVQALDAAVWAVNPASNSLADLASYLCQWAGDFFQPTAIRCRFEVADQLPPHHFPPTVRHTIFLSVKEALNNAARHSQASEVWLRIHADGATLNILIEDNGSGFTGPNRQGQGLRNLRERLSGIGGQIHFSTPPNGGTHLRISLPLL